MTGKRFTFRELRAQHRTTQEYLTRRQLKEHWENCRPRDENAPEEYIPPAQDDPSTSEIESIGDSEQGESLEAERM